MKTKTTKAKGSSAPRRISKKSMPSGYVPCRCCGKPVPTWLGSPIHTKCIPKHWEKHAHGVNASRCCEFRHKAKRSK